MSTAATPAAISSTRTLKALLWKDWRLARSLLIATAALYITPLVVGAVWLAIPSNSDHPQTFKDWLESGVYGLFISLIVSILATPMYGAVMFAKERRDRTAELVGSMPVRRGPIVLSKALILGILTLLPWLITALAASALWAIVRYALGVAPSLTPADIPDATGGLFLPGTVMLAIGTSWFFSSMVNKDTIAAGLSLFFTILTVVLTIVIWYRVEPEDDRIPHTLLSAITWSGGLACFIAGIVIALRRKTP